MEYMPDEQTELAVVREARREMRIASVDKCIMELTIIEET